MTFKPSDEETLVQRPADPTPRPETVNISQAPKEKRGKVISAEGRFKNDGKRVAIDLKVGETVLFGTFPRAITLEGRPRFVAHDEVPAAGPDSEVE